MKVKEFPVHVDQLRVGVFIRLDQQWFQHPFLISHFKIKTADQIDALKEAGIERVVCVPGKCDQLPLPLGDVVRSPAPDSPQAKDQKPAGGTIDEMWKVKEERIERLREQRKKMAERQKQFHNTVIGVQKIMRSSSNAMQAAIGEAHEVVDVMARSLLSDKDVVLHLMNTQSGVDDVSYHAMNVSVLAMMLAKECGFSEDYVLRAGLGAILHDIGKQRLPKKIILKQSALTPTEMKYYQLHPQLGEEMVASVEGLPEECRKVIRQHHETVDGMGYPDNLPGEALIPEAKVVAIADAFDNLCNKANPKDSLSPYQALAFMFGRQREKYDEQSLVLFVRCMGIYPPGTVVQLSSGDIGLVMSTNISSPLRPSVLLYDTEVPRDKALLFNLEDDPEITIAKTIQPQELPMPVCSYLNPQSRITYCVDHSNEKSGLR